MVFLWLNVSLCHIERKSKLVVAKAEGGGDDSNLLAGDGGSVWVTKSSTDGRWEWLNNTVNGLAPRNCIFYND